MTPTNYPALLVLAPLVAAIVCSCASWLRKTLCYPIALVGLVVSFFSSTVLLSRIIATGEEITYYMAGWSPPFGIEYRIDLLNSVVLVAVTAIALINLLASHQEVLRDAEEKSGTFYAVYLLFITGLIGVVATGDLFNLYVLLEITSLTSYALIAMGDPDRSPMASLNYVFIGVIGASFYLLGVGYIYIMTGSLNMMDVATLLPPLHGSTAVLVAFLFCMIGVWIKMALFPMHTWLPNAYAYAPIAAARAIAPLMTKVMVYVMIRLMVTVFGYDYIFKALHLSSSVVWLAAIAIVAGGILALGQRDLKKMAAYIIVSEIGYMVGGAWLGNNTGMTGSILHIINDAIMTFALFLAMGNIAFRTKNLRFENLSGLFAKMPWSMAGFALAGLSIIGVPPTCGFFSKWYLVMGGLEAGAYHFVAALIFSSLVCAILFFRVFEICFFESAPGDAAAHDHQGHHHAEVAIEEAPVSSLISLGVVSLLVILVGVYSGTIVQTIIVPFLG